MSYFQENIGNLFIPSFLLGAFFACNKFSKNMVPLGSPGNNLEMRFPVRILMREAYFWQLSPGKLRQPILLHVFPLGDFFSSN
jgi:hypothetical protein